jgi:hypothetical protein
MRTTSRYCSSRCRKRAQRAGLARSITAAIPQQQTDVVYYLRFADRVKIGTTSNLERRLCAIPHDEVLATEPGSFNLERRRHLQFADDRLMGEWFALSPALQHHIWHLNEGHAESGRGRQISTA